MIFPWFGCFPRSSGQLGLGKETTDVKEAVGDSNSTGV